MAKNNVSDWDGVTASNNTDVGGINISEGMPPSNVNDSIREIMRQVKAWQSGDAVVDSVYNGQTTFNADVTFNYTITLGNGTGSAGQYIKSMGSNSAPVWETMTDLALQTKNAVDITGGTITGTTINSVVVGTNGQGNKTVSTSASPSGGADGDIWYTLK